MCILKIITFFFRLAQTAKILVACVMVLSYALVFYVPVDVVWRRIQDRIPARNHRWGVAGLRLFGTLFTGILFLNNYNFKYFLAFRKYRYETCVLDDDKSLNTGFPDSLS